MTYPLAGETPDQLIEAARQDGFDVSRDQLVRWHKAGVLPRPTRTSLGRGRGMVSHYPAGTREQLLALCGMLAQDRSLELAQWRLWWSGHAISESVVREQLARQLSDQARTRADVERFSVEADDAISDEAFRQLEDRARRRIRGDQVLRRWQTSTRADFPALALAVVQVCTGATVNEHGLRLLLAELDFPDEMVEGSIPIVAQYGPLLSPSRLEAAFIDASDTQLREARDEFRSLLQLCEWLLNAFAGSGSLAGLANAAAEPTTPSTERLMLLMWLAARRESEIAGMYAFFSQSPRAAMHLSNGSIPASDQGNPQ